MRIRLYLKNAALLTAGGFALRGLGMVFRVLIASYLGGEGMGLYQLILAVYGVFVALASAGVNVASTRLAAQSLARGRGMAPHAVGACQRGVLPGNGGDAGAVRTGRRSSPAGACTMCALSLACAYWRRACRFWPYPARCAAAFWRAAVWVPILRPSFLSSFRV